MVKTAKYEVEEGKIRLYKRPNSPYFWTQINNEDGTIRRVSTKEKTVEKATKQAIRLSIETEQAIENNLPTNTKTFSSVAKTIIKELESYRDTDFWKEVYASYIQVIKNYQIPYFKNKQLNVVRNDYANYLKYVEKQMG
ncbi:MAG: hypothetical protein O3C54_00565, partial [Proteobacteria bacterium]|nr:hypothetical protein [Pseudomonadota bacterium]